jgi:hypothetical protein
VGFGWASLVESWEQSSFLQKNNFLFLCPFGKPAAGSASPLVLLSTEMSIEDEQKRMSTTGREERGERGMKNCLIYPDFFNANANAEKEEKLEGSLHNFYQVRVRGVWPFKGAVQRGGGGLFPAKG